MMEEESSSSDESSDSFLALPVEEQIRFYIRQGDEEEAIALIEDLEEDEVDVRLDAQDDEEDGGITLLHCAAEEGAVTVLRALLDAGADTTVCSGTFSDSSLTDATALHYAVFYGQVECVDVLLGFSDSEVLTTKNYADLTPLQQAVFECRGIPDARSHAESAHVKWMRERHGLQYVDGHQEALDIVDLFIRTDSIEDAYDRISDEDDSWEGCNLAHLAARFDILNLFKYFFAQDRNILYTHEKVPHEEDDIEENDSDEPYGPTPIHLLLCTEFNERNYCQQFLLNHLGEIDLDVLDRCGRSVVFYLVMTENRVILERVLAHNPKLWFSDHFKLGIFYYAIQTGNARIFRMLLDALHQENRYPGLDKQILNDSYDDQRLLHVAVDACIERQNSADSLQILDMLVMDPCVDVNKPNKFGRTVYLCATEGGNAEAIKVLQKNKKLDPNVGASDTGMKRQRVDALEKVTRLLEGVPECELIMGTVAELHHEAEVEEGTIYPDDEDEGDAPVHQGLKRDKKRSRSEAPLLPVMLQNARVDDHAKDKEGVTALKRAKQAKEEYPEGYQHFRSAQYDHYKESSSGGSGSEDDEGQSIYRTVLSDVLGEEDVPEDEQETLLSEADIEKDLARLNECIGNNTEIPVELAERYCVIHYRGINFLRNVFQHGERREYGLSGAGHGGVHSRLSHHNTYVPISLPSRNSEQEATLEVVGQQLRRVWQHVFLKKQIKLIKPWKNWGASEFNKKGFRCYAHLSQCRYSNQASVKAYANAQEQKDVWEEIWENITPVIQQTMQHDPDVAELDKQLTLKCNPFVSTGKTPQHAVRYALGKSLAEINRDFRMDGRYDREGRPKYELIGKVHWFLHSVGDYIEQNPNDVLLWHKAGYLSLSPRLLHETEVAFVGGIPAKHYVDAIPILIPRFDVEYDKAYHAKSFGLTPKQYEYFKTGFEEGQRPSKYNIDIFDKPYHPSLQKIFDLDPETFARYKSLITLVNQAMANKQKNLPLKQLEPFRDLLLKEINIKYSDRNNRANFYGRKDQDKYWHTSKNGKDIPVDKLWKFIQKNLRNRATNRKLKNELREHLMAFLSEVILRAAVKQAKAAGKVVIYRAPDGMFKQLPKIGGAAELKKVIVKNAKRGKSFDASSVNAAAFGLGFWNALSHKYAGSVPVADNQQRVFTFKLHAVEGDGNCAVTSLPVQDREALAGILLSMMQDPEHRARLADEIGDVLQSSDIHLLLSEAEKAEWQALESAQSEYDSAYQAYQSELARIKSSLIEKGFLPQHTSGRDTIVFIKNDASFNHLYKALSKKHLVMKKCKEKVDNIDAQRMAFLTRESICCAYIQKIIAKDKQFVGKGCMHLFAKAKKINLCIWSEQKDSNVLLFDRTNSVYDPQQFLEENVQVFHVIYRHHANHFDILQALSTQLENRVIHAPAVTTSTTL